MSQEMWPTRVRAVLDCTRNETFGQLRIVDVVDKKSHSTRRYLSHFWRNHKFENLATKPSFFFVAAVSNQL